MSRSVDKIPRLRARGRENRRKLLREAQRLMLEQDGEETLKFKEVFEAAGVSRGSAYRIYDGIEDLFQDIATEWVNNFVAFMRGSDPDTRPEHWHELSEFIVRLGAVYWSATAETLRLLPRLRANQPGSYRLAVEAMSRALVDLFDRYFIIPEIPHWSHKLGFLTELCDVTFADAVRTEGYISEERLKEAAAIGETFLSFHLPANLPARRVAS
ncbi:MAG: TetR/AcrR family transcriptional regulator [Gammaproteobacteria bacterium]|nr:TetR/AcrR family transcriptional regulator [Gammaproteobacteria bacterium]